MSAGLPAILFGAFAFSGAIAADPAETGNGRPSLAAVKVEQGPVIDGKLDDPVWARAPAGGPLTQYEPRQRVPATERTEFRVLYDERNLYLGVWCHDSEPEKIIARLMERESSLWLDDNVIFVLDTFHDRRNGYVFFVNPNGARRDGLVIDNVTENHDWDGDWTARASIDAEGWKVEIAIPFMTLAFDPDLTTWGFNIQRTIQRKAEDGRWSRAEPRFRVGNVAEAGTLTGLAGLKQGLGLEIRPYALGRVRKEDARPRAEIDFESGGDLRYRLAPDLSAALSVNTDFAETEVDQRQINLTRFPLFFPEKRRFFLEDSGVFEFGGLQSYEFLPYFSRRIGLSAGGEVVPIDYAGKVSGRTGPYSLGFIDASMAGQDELGKKNLFVGRVSRDVLEQSSVGALFTAGDPNSADENYLLGADAQFRTTDFLGDKALQANLFAMGSLTEPATGDSTAAPAWGLNAAYPNDTIDLSFRFVEIGADFNPALGFVPRQDIRQYNSGWAWQPRPESSDWIRQFSFGYYNSITTDLSNDLETAWHGFTPLEIQFTSSDRIFVTYNRNLDAPDGAFTIGEDVVIAPGDYDWGNVTAGFELAPKRLVSGTFFTTQGGFYDGQRSQYSARLDVLPWKRVSLGLTYDFNQIDLPGGEFETHLGAARMGWHFTPDMFVAHLIQYDSLSDTIGYNGRFQWEYRPGSFVYAVYNQSLVREENSRSLSFVTGDWESIFKLGVSIRF
ncbi:MAG: carbohydrate binding family 9 domain-containing protein [Verrucomicrobiae bacterium]|nr:carbohydrate binding family 9 domain-containing protein [Verrucomicrobiae bacterium]